MYIPISEVHKYLDQEILIKGWVFNRRSSGKIHFLQIRDGSGFIQAVASINDVSNEIFEACKKLTQETAIELTALVKEEHRSKMGYELVLKNIKVLSEPLEDYPISNKEHGVEFLMDHRHLWLRSMRQHAILKIRHTINNAAREWLNQQGFILIESPIITPSTAEGTSELFEIDYFGESAYLSQTGQLYAEAAALAFGKVYTFGPTFRAEKSKTRRHLNEFWMLEPEMAFVDQEGNMQIQERLIEYIITKVLKVNQLELDRLNVDSSKLEKIKAPFPRITHAEAVNMLKEQGDFDDISKNGDFGAPHEIWLSEQFEGKPVFVTNYPQAIKAFYMQPDPNLPTTVKCADLLYPGFGEIIGGSERIYDYDVLLKRIQEEKLPQDVYEWYLDLRKYGTVPHSGFGLGLERMVTVICGNEHIREAIPFARTLNRVRP